MTYQASRDRRTSTMNCHSDYTHNQGDEAMTFCRKVKHVFRNKPQAYQQFVKVISEIKEEGTDKVEIIKRVIMLFDGYPELVKDFNLFLPIDYKIEMQGDAVLVKVFDETDEDAVGLVETGRFGMLTAGGTMTYGPGLSSMSTSTLGGGLTAQKLFDASSTMCSTDSLGNTHFGTETLGPNKDTTMEYIRKVKKTFSGQPRTYRRFMEALRAYHKEEADVLDTVKTIVSLFQNHTDLVLAFNEFLPRSHRIRMFDHSGYVIQHPSSTEEGELESFQIMLDQQHL